MKKNQIDFKATKVKLKPEAQHPLKSLLEGSLTKKLIKKKGHNKEYLGKANVEHLLYVNTKLASSNFANYIEEDCRYLIIQEQGI